MFSDALTCQPTTKRPTANNRKTYNLQPKDLQPTLRLNQITACINAQEDEQQQREAP